MQDLNAVIWMEDTLRKYKGTIIVVSHDQNFLAEVTTDIIHLEDKKLHYYRGDFNLFKEMREQQREKQKKVGACMLFLFNHHRGDGVSLYFAGLRQAREALEGSEDAWQEQ